ncbi:MAG: hypothetical protein ACI4ML_07460 [Aristaeellaceae bacterium]
MSAQICPSCLSQKFDQGRCQNCGFNRTEYWPAQQALPLDTMVGKYRIGLLKAASRQSQVYTGIDVYSSSPVLIEEFLPAKVAGRHPEDPRVLLAKNDAQTQQRFQKACRMIEESTQNRPLRKLTVFRANNTVYTVFTPMSNAPVDAQCEALADHPVYFRGPDDQPLMTINALPIPPMPLERAYHPNGEVGDEDAAPVPPDLSAGMAEDKPVKPRRKGLLLALIAVIVVAVLAVGGVLLIPALTRKPEAAMPEPSVAMETPSPTPTQTLTASPEPTGPEATVLQDSRGIVEEDMSHGAAMIVMPEGTQGSGQPASGQDEAVQDEDASGTEDAAPAVKNSTAGDAQTGPAVKGSAPDNEQAVPVLEQSEPEAEDTEPEGEEPAPETGDTEPEAEELASDTDDAGAEAEELASGADGTEPEAEEAAPGADEAAEGQDEAREDEDNAAELTESEAAPEGEPQEETGELPAPPETVDEPQVTQTLLMEDAALTPANSALTSREALLEQLRVIVLKSTKIRLSSISGYKEVELQPGDILELCMKENNKREWIFCKVDGNGYNVNLKLPEEMTGAADSTLDSAMRICFLQGSRTILNDDVQLMLRVWADCGTLREGDYVVADNIEDLIHIEEIFLDQKKTNVSLSMGGSEGAYSLTISYQDRKKQVQEETYPISVYQLPGKDEPSAPTQTTSPTPSPAPTNSHYGLINQEDAAQSMIQADGSQDDD